MTELAIPEDLETVPSSQAVFLLWPRTGKPFLARTNVLGKRLRRLWTTLGGAVERIEYQFTGSRLESQFLLWELAREHLGPGYRQEIRLRLPPYLKLVRSN